MKVIAVANQKGGVGKTTVTRELSACCALRGYQTLVIDSDPQANLTASWVEPDIYNITLSHVLIEPEAQTAAQTVSGDADRPLPPSPPAKEKARNNNPTVTPKYQVEGDWIMESITRQPRTPASPNKLEPKASTPPKEVINLLFAS